MVSGLGSLVQLCCREGGTLQTNITGMCGGVLAVFQPHWVCSRLWHVCFPSLHCSGSRLPYRERALGCVHLPGLSHSGSASRVLHKGADSVGPAFCALPRSEQLRRPVAWQAHSPQVASASYHLPSPGHLDYQVVAGALIYSVPCVSSGDLISSCDPLSRCQPSRIPGSLDQKLEDCSQFGRGCHLWDAVCLFQALSGAHLPPASSVGQAHPQPASSPLVLCSVSGPGSALGQGFSRDSYLSLSLFSFFLSLSLAIPQFRLLSHVSSLRFPSGHSGLVLTLSNVACSSLFSPCLLVVDVRVWGTSPLGVALRHVICGFYLFFLLFMLPSEIPKLPTDPLVRGFPDVCKLLLF